MKFLLDGKVMFDNINELYYQLFLEIGLCINNDNYLYDQDTNIFLKYKDKFIKAAVDTTPIYAGKNDIIFDPSQNYNLATTILGYYIDKQAASLEGDRIKFIAHFVVEEGDKQRVVVRTQRGDISSQLYYNIYLAYIECVFLLAESFYVNLSNFDINNKV